MMVTNKNELDRLQDLLTAGRDYLRHASEAEILHRPNPHKWSKKEILGHLIDSAINNLKRFTEITFEEQPYKIIKYNQAGLVLANDYQNADTDELITLWIALNTRITSVVKRQTEETLDYSVEVEEGQVEDFKFLIIDYVDHLEHHIMQILTT